MKLKTLTLLIALSLPSIAAAKSNYDKEIVLLNRKINALAKKLGSASNPLTNGNAANLEARIDQLEEKLRGVTGNKEVFQHRLNNSNIAINNFSEKYEAKLNDLFTKHNDLVTEFNSLSANVQNDVVNMDTRLKKISEAFVLLNKKMNSLEDDRVNFSKKAL